MFSNDKNVETLGQLINELKEYVGLRKEYLKFDVTERVVRVVTVIVMATVTFVLLLAILFYLSMATVFWIAPAVGMAAAFAIVAAAFALVLVLLVLFRKRWLERPLVRFMVNVLGL